MPAAPVSAIPSAARKQPRRTAITPMAFVQAIVAAYRRYGVDPGTTLARAQITPELLGSPNARISATQMELVSGAAMQELDDEALGWFSRRLPWGSYGMLARASISAPNLGVALARWCRHHGLLVDDVTLALETAQGQAAIRITERCDLGGLREFCLVSLLRNIHGVACWLVDSRIPLQRAQFPFPAPPHHGVYQTLFTGETQFASDTAAIGFDARYLALPLRRDERALRQMLQRALPLTVLPYRRDRLLVARARQVLAEAPLHAHNAEALAAQLHVSARTLHRQLREEGASLQGLKDEMRRSSAEHLLLRTDRPIKLVAAAAGFRNEKSFMRAFRHWTGQSPAEFRRSGRLTPTT